MPTSSLYIKKIAGYSSTSNSSVALGLKLESILVKYASIFFSLQ